MTTRNRQTHGMILVALCALASGCDTNVAIANVGRGPGFDGGGPVSDGFGRLPDGACATAPEGGVDLSATDPHATTNPPPISGGTLLITRDGHYAIAADPDQDTIFVVDRTTHVVRSIALQAGDEPGRLIEDPSGTVHCVLRRAGAIAHLDPTSATLLGRDPVCTTPRGIAFDAANNVLRVACADGHLVSLPAAGGSPVANTFVEDDLRDIVFDSTGAMYLTRFRSAGIMFARASSQTPADLPFFGISGQSPDIAWRAVAAPDGGAIIVHQLASTAPIDLGDGCSSPYGGGSMAPRIVNSAVTYVATDGQTQTYPIGDAPVPVDVAISPDGSRIAVAAAGNGLRDGMGVVTLTVAAGRGVISSAGAEHLTGMAVAVAFAPDGTLVVQTRSPAAVIDASDQTTSLGTARRAELGHAIFHTATSSGLACASCHAEGQDDGHVWSFDTMGLRRTQTFRGGFLATAPFHWDGALHDVPALVGDVYVHRMGGSPLTSEQSDALAHWMDALPLLTQPPADDALAVERGRVLFNDAAVGCATCHAGPAFTNNANMDVGTGGTFQVPSLRGLRWRAPYMHNGCAATIAARFITPCGGGESHGHTAALSTDQRADLIAYLQML